MSRWVMPRLMASRSGGHRFSGSSLFDWCDEKNVCDPDDSGLRGLHAMKQHLFKLAVPSALPRAAKRLVALSVDLGLCVLIVWLAY